MDYGGQSSQHSVTFSVFFNQFFHFVLFSSFLSDLSGQLECSSDCMCPTGRYEPVCVDDSITFTSPCSAGCTSHYNSTTDVSDQFQFQFMMQFCLFDHCRNTSWTVLVPHPFWTALPNQVHVPPNATLCWLT